MDLFIILWVFCLALKLVNKCERFLSDAAVCLYSDLLLKRILRTLSTRPIILVFISINFQWQMEQHFPEFGEKSTTSRGIPKFSEIFYRECPFHLSFLPELLVEWFTFRKFDNFRIFWKLFQKVSFPRNFWLNGNPPMRNPRNARVTSVEDLDSLPKNNL